jgi:hypothetical protein
MVRLWVCQFKSKEDAQREGNKSKYSVSFRLGMAGSCSVREHCDLVKKGEE